MKHILLFSALFGFSVAPTINVCAQMPASHGLGFTPNQGQFADQSGKSADHVLFKTCGTGPAIYVTTSGLTYMFIAPEEKNDSREEISSGNMNWSAIHMNLVGATISQENIEAEQELPGVSNYYYPHCANGITGVKSYAKVTIHNIYPGIDWVLSADPVNGMMHDFIVAPDGKHTDIRMRYTGLTAPITLNEKNQLTLVSKYGTMYEGGLLVKRQDDGRVLTSYFNVSGNEVTYLIVRGARGRCGMIIDPPLQWDSLQASSGMDYGYGVAAARDGSGDVMGCGYTDGSDFPVMNATQGTLSGQEDAVVYRLNGNGTRLWSTYFGGTDIDNCKGIATDNAGNCYVTGHTNSQDLPVMNSLQQFFGGGVYDAFIAKYNAQGVMQWASWRGGTGNDFGTAITCDQVGTCYVVGYSTSTNFPMLNAYQPTKSNVADGFVFSVNASQVMQWSTYYGGNDEDRCYAVTLDAQEANVCFGGNTNSGNFPTFGNPFQLFNGQAFFTSDGFIVKMPTHGQSVVFASYCGGDEDENLRGITCDDAGNIYATGYTMSSDFPVVDPGGSVYMDSTQNGIGVQDAFIVKCNPLGTTLLWSTYFGGTASDYAIGIDYDQFVGIYVCGFTASTDFPVMQPLDMNYYQSTHGDGGSFNDMFIAWFNVNDEMAWSTYYGFANAEEAYAVSVGQQNEIFMAGTSFNDISTVKFNPGIPTYIAICPSGIVPYTVFPNPATEAVTVVVYAPEGIVPVRIFDVTGKLVREQQATTVFGENFIRVNVGDLSAGEYTLQIVTPENDGRYKFIKQ